MSDVYIDVVHPLKALQEGIGRNLTEIPSNTRKIIDEIIEISQEIREGNEEENRKLNDITKLGALNMLRNEEEKVRLDNLARLSTLNLIQGSETKKDTLEMKSDLEDLKLTIKKINQRVIEYGIFQEDLKSKEMQEKETKVKKEKKKKETPIKFQKYKPKRPPSDSSSSSSSSDEGEGEKDVYHKNNLKIRKLIRPNITTNVLDIEYIKKALAETENGTQFGKLMKNKGYEFTKVHKMEERH
jgi:hypothetical protein